MSCSIYNFNLTKPKQNLTKPYLSKLIILGLPGAKKLQGPNLAISGFIKGQIIKNEKQAK